MMQQTLRTVLQRGTTHRLCTCLLQTTSTQQEIFKVQSTEDFDKKVKKSDKLVVVDFFATWCNPCKMLTPRIEKIVSEKAGVIKLAKVDIDEFGELALDYDVGAVPVLMMMKDGKVLNRIIGLHDIDEIRAWIEKAVEESE